MPHLVTMLTPEGKSVIYGAIEPEQFNRDLESLVAAVFNQVADEDLVPGENVKLRGSFDSGSMPKHFVLVVMAWQTMDRNLLQFQLEESLNEALAEYFKNKGVLMRHFQIYLNMVGERPH